MNKNKLEKLKLFVNLSQEEKDKFNLMSDMNMWGRREFLSFFDIDLLDRVGMCEWALQFDVNGPQYIIGNQYDDIETLQNNVKVLVKKELDKQKKLDDYSQEL